MPNKTVQIKFTLDELSREDWFEGKIQESICILLISKNSVLSEYATEKRVIPNLSQIKQLNPEFYETTTVIGSYDGTKVMFEIDETMNNESQTEELDLDNMDDLLDCFDGETVEGGVDSENDIGCEGGACKL